MDVCRPVRANDGNVRLDELAQTGRCDALRRWFHGVREHLIFTPSGRIRQLVQLPGNCNDAVGLYELVLTDFVGHLLADNGYWPRPYERLQLKAKGITVAAATRKDFHFQHSAKVAKRISRERHRVDRRIGLFNQQFHAGRTLCRSARHYLVRRWLKAIAHNLAMNINAQKNYPLESVAHYQLAA